MYVGPVDCLHEWIESERLTSIIVKDVHCSLIRLNHIHSSGRAVLQHCIEDFCRLYSVVITCWYSNGLGELSWLECYSVRRLSGVIVPRCCRRRYNNKYSLLLQLLFTDRPVNYFTETITVKTTKQNIKDDL